MGDFDFSQLEQEILEESSTIFSGESQKDIQKKIQTFSNTIKKLRVGLEAAQANNKNARKNLTYMMKQSYSTIMGFRTSLFGEQETITYRIYVRGENINSVNVVNLTESQIMKYVERSGNTLRLKRALDGIEEQNRDAEVETLFQKHFANISRSLVHKHGNNFVVPYSNVSDVVSGQAGSALYWQKSATKDGPHPYTPKMFNRGWIYQAFDATIMALMEQEEDITKVSTQTFRREYFVNQLKFDNVTGFKGGDVGLNQIKSNMANLMNLKTLIKYLKIIEEILDPINYTNKEELKLKILQEFSENNTITENANTILDTIVDRLLSSLST